MIQHCELTRCVKVILLKVQCMPCKAEDEEHSHLPGCLLTRHHRYIGLDQHKQCLLFSEGALQLHTAVHKHLCFKRVRLQTLVQVIICQPMGVLLAQ